MAQQTLSDLIQRVKAWSNRKDLSDDLYKDFINIALARAVRVLRLPIMEAEAALTITGNAVTLPRDYLEAKNLSVEVGSCTVNLERKDLAYVQEQAKGTGTPLYFARRGTKFYLAPTPSGITTASLYYYIALQPLIVSTDTNWFVADAPEILLYGALSEIALYVKDEISAAQWEAKFQAHAQELQRLADKAEWSGSTLAVTAR